ncbi:polysaccharide deacetylase family protein [Neobacillus cucumis]|nr:polysaccharide deacetylase family protein [Neobacillus cucumis]
MEQTSKKRYVALTFDDGPSEYTPHILRILKYYRVKATFFIVGKNVTQSQHQILKQLISNGNVLGNHTWNHPNITKLSQKKLTEEIESTNQVIKKITNQEVQIFRPPYGEITEESEGTVLGLGLIPVLWDLDTLDWNLSIQEPIEERVSRQIQRDHIILMHDGGGRREKTVEALPKIIEYLKNQDYEFLTIPEYFRKVFHLELGSSKKH